ncbi:Nucleoporin GLE1 [Caenorhabditis elegans]|uniref:Nucleoporin GLE1 n=1 Tax=Caenorhabditis elegans TaxID=6239 RepID=Q9N572_CAEEL|nr:Nucleoporin GLE1 [Caenorhabditis elegans]CCD68712.1 Nucleoporin GLE1 [Caenorhabditis elegans]|eukprot:NP_500639.2 Nuclear Pore complex Protein [Caenorhabditis elegans]
MDLVKVDDDVVREMEIRRQQHSKKYDRKFEELVKSMSEAHVEPEKMKIPFSRKPTEQETNNLREEWEKEYAALCTSGRTLARPNPNSSIFSKILAQGSPSSAKAGTTRSTPRTSKPPSADENIIFGQKLPETPAPKLLCPPRASPGSSRRLSIFVENLPENHAEIVRGTIFAGREAKIMQNDPENVPSTSTYGEPIRPYLLFARYISLEKGLLDDKNRYKSATDPRFREFLKENIKYKVKQSIKHRTSSEACAQILNYFKTLLQKQEVQVLGGYAPVLQLKTNKDIEYASLCIVHNYVILAERDESLIPLISSHITRLSVFYGYIEQVFCIILLSRSALLRQHPEECMVKFLATSMNPSSPDAIKKWSRQKAHIILFCSVFTKNAYCFSKGFKLKLTDEILWKYVDASTAHILEIPRGSFILWQLITTCKPRLQVDKERWIQLLLNIKFKIIPELDLDSFDGDEAMLMQLKQTIDELLHP